jgi:hypothetical protein
MPPRDADPQLPSMTHATRVPRPSPAHRAAALLAAVLFVFAWAGDAFGYHPCAHHSALAPHVGAAASPSAADGGHDAHAGHYASPEGPGTSAPAAHDGACLCVGGCPVAGASLPAGAEVAVAPVADTSEPRPLASPAAGLPRFRPHVLPFAQAPPSLS